MKGLVVVYRSQSCSARFEGEGRSFSTALPLRGSMRTLLLHAALALSCLLLSGTSGVTSLPPGQFHGIAPHDESYYKADVIKCKDGSKKFTQRQLNDEFCDCPDGTDEPGTSACPEGKFYCRNVGHIPKIIFSSRVNDGICDCCDGSDEYNGNTNSLNTCWEAGKEERERLKKKIATHQDGLAIRKKEVEKAKQAFAKDEAELLKLKNEEKILNGLVEKLRDHKEKIEKVENEERLRKENEEKEQRDAERKLSEQNKSSEDNIAANEEPKVQVQNEDHPGFAIPADESLLESVFGDEDSTIPTARSNDETRTEVQPQNEDDPGFAIPADESLLETMPEDKGSTLSKAWSNDETGTKVQPQHEDDPGFANPADEEDTSEVTEGLSREELGRRIASRWTGEQSTKESDEPNDAKEEGLGPNRHSSNNEDEDYGGYYSDSNDDRYKHGDREFEDDENEEYGDDSYDAKKDDESELSATSWLEKIQQTVQSVLQSFNFFKSPVDISDAARVKKEYEDANSKLSKLKSRIFSLTEKLKHDYGKEREFYTFYDRCFESKQNKYVYKVCPFKKASQVDGHSTTQLGSWENFDESYRVMEFSNGDICWNGPDRSMKVRLRCGLRDELADVDEPSRCEYIAILTTPISCLEDKLKELQQKLNDFIKHLPPDHNEL